MSNLIHTIQTTSAAKRGVNILEEANVSASVGIGGGVISCVAHLPWGDISKVKTITSPAHFRRTFFPSAFTGQSSYESAFAFEGLLFNHAFVSGVRASDAVKASLTLNDSLSAPLVTITAKYASALGNQIKATLAVGDSATQLDLTIKVGNRVEFFKDAITQTGSSPDFVYTINVDSAWVDVAWVPAEPAEIPAAFTETNLASGSDGTLVATDFAPASGSTGLRAFRDSRVLGRAVFAAGVPASLKPAVSAAMTAQSAEYAYSAYVLPTPASLSSYSAASAWASTNGTTLHGEDVYVLTSRIEVYDPYLNDGSLAFVDANGTFACVYASVSLREGAFGKPSLRFTRHIKGIEFTDFTPGEMSLLPSLGLNPLSIERAFAGQAIIMSDETFSATPIGSKIRRTYGEIAEKGTEIMLEYYGMNCDVDIDAQKLGPVSGEAHARLEAKVKGMATDGTVRAAAVDAFAGTQDDVNQGIWQIAIVVQAFDAIKSIILSLSVSTTA